MEDDNVVRLSSWLEDEEVAVVVSVRVEEDAECGEEWKIGHLW
jgi:hypothetical protein